MIIDVSHHQGVIDWGKTAKVIDGAYIKATQGVGHVDKKCLYNAAEARHNGLKIGYYHYASITSKKVVQDATEEAKWFVKNIQGLPSPQYPAVLDIEENSGLSKNEVLDWINTFFKVLEKEGVADYVLYSYKYFLDGNLPADHNLGHIKLWLAQYVPEGRLKLPKGWEKYWMWQYTCEGKIQGIETNVDLNKCSR